MQINLDFIWGNDLGDYKFLREVSNFEVKIAQSQAALCTQWLDALGRDVISGRLCQSSWMSIRRELRPWIHYLEKIIKNDAPESHHVIQYADYQLSKHHSNTVNNRLDVISRLYTWAASANLYRNITDKIPRLNPGQGRAQKLVKVEVSEMIAFIPKDSEIGLRNRAIIALLSDGLETVSIHRATVLDFNSSHGAILHQPRRHVVKDVTTTLSDSTVRLLNDYLQMRFGIGNPGGALDAPLIPSSVNTKVPLSTLSMRMMVRRLSRKLPDSNKKCVTPSSLRYTATHYTAKIMGLNEAAKRFGTASKYIARILRRNAAD